MKLGRQCELVTSEPGWTANMFELVRDRAAGHERSFVRSPNWARSSSQESQSQFQWVAVLRKFSLFYSHSLSLPLCLLVALHVLCNKWAQLTQSKISEYYQSCMQVHACACWSIRSKRVSRPHMKHIKVVREIKKAKRNSLSGEREMLFRMIHKCLNVHCWVK